MLHRITGLDPAFPFYYPAISGQPLSQRDAEFVDAIHSDTFFVGTPYRVGHADFFPNNGKLQPGCPNLHPLQVLNSWVWYKANLNPFSLGTFNSRFIIVSFFCVLLSDFCSHHQAYFFWSESLLRKNFFPSKSCENWRDFKNSRCDNNPTNYMGFDADPGLRGVFFNEISGRTRMQALFPNYNIHGFMLNSFVDRSDAAKLLKKLSKANW